jgi:hypothetical protein
LVNCFVVLPDTCVHCACVLATEMNENKTEYLILNRD